MLDNPDISISEITNNLKEIVVLAVIFKHSAHIVRIGTRLNKRVDGIKPTYPNGKGTEPVYELTYDDKYTPYMSIQITDDVVNNLGDMSTYSTRSGISEDILEFISELGFEFKELAYQLRCIFNRSGLDKYNETTLYKLFLNDELLNSLGLKWVPIEHSKARYDMTNPSKNMPHKLVYDIEFADIICYINEIYNRNYTLFELEQDLQSFITEVHNELYPAK